MADLLEIAPTALELAGVPYTDADLELLRVIVLAFGPGMQALDEADLQQLPIESDLDPARAPRADRAPAGHQDAGMASGGGTS